MKPSIPCLSVQQPWAGLIVSGVKDVENRVWTTAHRGTILIHASKREDVDASAFYQTRPARQMFLKGGHLPPSTLKFGAIIGAATVDDCYLYGKATSGGTSLWHEFGKVGWYLSNAILFDKHIPYRGQLGLFPVPIHVIADVTCNGKPVELKAGDAQ